PFPRLSMARQCPATQDRPSRRPERKALFRREDDGGFGTLLGNMLLTTELMEYRCTTQGKTEAKRVRNLLCQTQRFVHLEPRLGWIPQQPQCPRGVAAARHPSILPVEKRVGAVLLGIIERDTLCQVRVRSGNGSHVERYGS